MIEPVNYWTAVLVGLTLFVTSFTQLIKAFEELMENLPKLLKPLTKFFIYSLTLVVPNIGIIWYFFYLAGFSPYRFSESRFFWAMVAQPTIGVSAYAYIWGRWLYPQLQKALGESTSERTSEKDVDLIKDNISKKSRFQRKPNRQSRVNDKTPRKGGKR